MLNETGLERRTSNYVPLSPIALLSRTADVHPDRIAVRHGDKTWTYQVFRERCLRLAAALARHGIVQGDVVSILAPNTPAHLEAHFGVAMAGAVLHSINIRLDAGTIAFQLAHAKSRLLLIDEEFAPVGREALAMLPSEITVVHIADSAVPADPLGAQEYESFIAPAIGEFRPHDLGDEWDAISLNYTSGTTGDPKGVVYHHRGAYLNAIGNIVAWGLAGAPVYLWTLPMFHCNGWCFPWTITALGGTHVCLRRADPAAIAHAIATAKVTHMCGDPIILTMLANAPEEVRALIPSGLQVMTAGAPPPAAVIGAIEAMGLVITHTYGMTETYGPCVVCDEQSSWGSLPDQERAAMKARQGVRYQLQESVDVLAIGTSSPVPADGMTMGEVAFRGNIVMKGYLANPQASEAAFADGWMHSGDLAVKHADGYIEIKDRLKDIIISGGENISTIEVESALFQHPAVLEAAVVACPDPKWGERPLAFVALKPGMQLSEQDLLGFARTRLAGFKIPSAIVFGELPKTATGKIKKFELRERARLFQGEEFCGYRP